MFHSNSFQKVSYRRKTSAACFYLLPLLHLPKKAIATALALRLTIRLERCQTNTIALISQVFNDDPGSAKTGSRRLALIYRWNCIDNGNKNLLSGQKRNKFPEFWRKLIMVSFGIFFYKNEKTVQTYSYRSILHIQ